jgi:hypothetical protein
MPAKAFESDKSQCRIVMLADGDTFDRIRPLQLQATVSVSQPILFGPTRHEPRGRGRLASADDTRRNSSTFNDFPRARMLEPSRCDPPGTMMGSGITYTCQQQTTFVYVCHSSIRPSTHIGLSWR